MFREMQKKRNQINIDKAKELLHNSRRGILSMNDDNGYPYAVPVNYLYDEDTNKIIFHGAKVGHKVDCLKLCDKVCFTVVGNEIIKEKEWAPFVQSVVVFGRCCLIKNDDAASLVKKFAMKYYPNENMVDEEVAISSNCVQMFEINIEHISGKEVQEI